jgi:hypothetical protein
MEKDHDDAIIVATQSKERVDEDFIILFAGCQADLSLCTVDDVGI